MGEPRRSMPPRRATANVAESGDQRTQLVVHPCLATIEDGAHHRRTE